MHAAILTALALPFVAVPVGYAGPPDGPGARPAHTPADGVAQQRDGTLRLTTDRVVVFKDGHALLVKTARGRVGPDGTVAMAEVPDSAVLGSFWATCGAVPIRALRAEWVETEEVTEREVPCTRVRDLLAANQGRELVLTLQWPSERQLLCKVVRVLEADPSPEGDPWAGAPPAGVDPYSSFRHAPAGAPEATAPAGARVTRTALTPVGGAFVELELPSAGGAPQQVVLPVADVRSVAGTGLRTTWTSRTKVTTRRKRLTFDFGAEAAGKDVVVSILYFSPGVRWIPTYRLTGDLDTDGTLALQAEILNELEDIDGAAVDLVVGVPNFRFGETISPLSLERTMRNVLRQAAPDLMGQGNAISNALFSQRAGEHVRAAESGDGLQVEPELAGTGEHDMFVHPVPRLSLPRGARATVPLWTAEPALRHLYTFDVRRVHDVGRPRPAAVQTSPLALAKNEVWHQLELTNGGPMPWTTGPALVLKGTLPLSQELLTYTPPGARTLLPLTVAVNVRGTYEEEQTAVQPNALTWNRSVYARVTLRGKARVANHERHAVDVRVRASVGGRVLQADGDAKVVLRGHDPADWQGASFDARPNGHSDVTWNVRLEPGAEQELTFEFEVFQS